MSGRLVLCTLMGLSPRLRGNAVHRLRSAFLSGSIPALAGERERMISHCGTPWVYPRACGGTAINGLGSRLRPGLSPRLRGNAIRYFGQRHKYGSIPALAGERSACPSSARQRRVYPRACGGTEKIASRSTRLLGLSPRLRGNAGNPVGRSRSRGSIPALAGERRMTECLLRIKRVYPRACGGTAFSSRLRSSSLGLSPRLRGNALLSDLALWGFGSIPALAGERPNGRAISVAIRVYPRACGGTWVRYSRRDRYRGLSPRLRGNGIADVSTAVFTGSIPALAGEHTIPACLIKLPRVYPRACGGTRYKNHPEVIALGLSPRLRGNALLSDLALWGFGSIPALAGERPNGRAISVAIRVYPRACGGTWVRYSRRDRYRGLSPRLRGNALQESPRGDCLGSIPALAGERLCRSAKWRFNRVYPRACGGTLT